MKKKVFSILLVTLSLWTFANDFNCLLTPQTVLLEVNPVPGLKKSKLVKAIYKAFDRFFLEYELTDSTPEPPPPTMELQPIERFTVTVRMVEEDGTVIETLEVPPFQFEQTSFKKLRQYLQSSRAMLPYYSLPKSHFDLDFRAKDGLDLINFDQPFFEKLTVYNVFTGEKTSLIALISFNFLSKKATKKLIEIVKSQQLGLLVRSARRVYRGFEKTLSNELFFNNEPNFTAQLNDKTITPQFLVLQDHHKGHSFGQHREAPHFNLRGLYFNPDLQEVTHTGQHGRIKVEIIHDSHKDNEFFIPTQEIETKGLYLEKNVSIFSQMFFSDFNADLPRNDTLFQLTNEKTGDIILEASFSELTDSDFQLLEELGVLILVDLNNTPEHFYY